MRRREFVQAAGWLVLLATTPVSAYASGSGGRPFPNRLRPDRRRSTPPLRTTSRPAAAAGGQLLQAGARRDVSPARGRCETGCCRCPPPSTGQRLAGDDNAVLNP